MFLYIREVYNPDMEHEASETAPKKATYFINCLPISPPN